MRRFRPYFKYLRSVRGPLIWAVVCGIIYGAANGAGLPLMIYKILPRIFDPQEANVSWWEIFAVAAWVPVVFLVRGLAGYFNGYLIQVAGVRILESLRLDYFKKIQRLPLSFLQSQNTGDLISRGLADTNQLQFTLTNIANDGMKQPFSLVGSMCAIAFLAYKNSGVGLVLASLALVPICVFPVRYIGKKLVKRSNQVMSHLGQVTNRLAENLSAAKEVRAFGLEEREARQFNESTGELIRSQLKAAKYDKALTPAIEIISAFGISITFVYAYEGGVSLSAMIAILTALYTCYDPIKKLGAISNDLKRGEASLNRLEVIFNEPIRITDPVDPVNIGQLRGTIQFKNVGFAYTANEPVLSDIDVTIPQGTVCALVGPSGAGKSTFANLVPRFYDAVLGSVTIDGLDVRTMRLADLRRNIAIVSQDPVLFNDTIYNNILLGREGASRDEVMAAARNAHADEFIRMFPNGYDTIVGERGTRLSGGQKQRLAVARAFLRNAPILILDEATSALDSESEQMIQDALKKLVVGKTVLIIAHRFSTIRDASMILVFDRGHVIATGDHAELYEESPLYKKLYDRQAAGVT